MAEVVEPPDLAAAPAAAVTPKLAANSRVVMQLNKLKDANNKYKSLLKLAKERITTQEQEMEACKG
jgi:sulfur transfer protein SufE